MNKNNGKRIEKLCRTCGRWATETHNLNGRGATCSQCFNRLVAQEDALAREEREYAEGARALQYPV